MVGRKFKRYTGEVVEVLRVYTLDGLERVSYKKENVLYEDVPIYYFVKIYKPL